MRYFSFCILLFLPISMPLGAADFELNEDSLAELSRDVHKVFAKHSGYRFKKVPAIVLSSPREIGAVLKVELLRQYKSLKEYNEATARRMAAQYSDIIAKALMAKYATEKHQVMVSKVGIEKMSKLISVPALRSREVLASILVHELVHAMDAESTGIFSRLGTAKTTDALWVINCLVEGHAQHVARGICKKAGWLKAFEIFTRAIGTIPESDEESEATRLLARAITDRFASAYYDGERFIAALHASGGSRQVAKAFAEPPKTSDAILKPEWYLDPALRREAVDIDAVFAEFESFSTGKKPGKQKGPWPTIKPGAGRTAQRLSVSKTQLAGMFTLLGKQESVDQLIREIVRTRALVIQEAGAGITVVLSELESPDSAARYLALVDQLNRLKDEKMKTGPIQIKSAEYEKMRGKGWHGDYVAKSVKTGFRGLEVRGATIVCGKYAMEISYSNRPPEKKTIRGSVDFLVGLILDHKSSEPGKPQAVPGKGSGRKETGSGAVNGPGWVFPEKRKLKYKIEYLNAYRFKSGDNTDKEDESEREMRDEAGATVIFSAGDSTGSTTSLSIEFQHLGLKSGSDDNPGYARYDSGLADSDLGKSRKIRWGQALKDGSPSISVTPGGRITEAKGFDGAAPQHGKLGMVLFGNQFLRAPSLPQKPVSGRSWEGSLTLMHCVDSPLQRYGWDAFEVEVPMVFTIKKISGGEYSVEGAVPPKTTLSMGDPRNEAYIPASAASGTWKGKWSRDHWKSTSWDVTASFDLGEISGALNSRYSATLKK